jgi:hypothetical protein
MTDNKSKSVAALEADLHRLGIPLAGLDPAWAAQTREETEAVIVALRQDPRFASALPATAIWPELQWQEKK